MFSESFRSNIEWNVLFLVRMCDVLRIDMKSSDFFVRNKIGFFIFGL